MASNNDGLMIVNCSATHLTSFAILVDVAGVHEKSVSMGMVASHPQQTDYVPRSEG